MAKKTLNDISGLMSLCAGVLNGGGYGAVHCTIFQSIPGIYPLDASSTPSS